MTCPPGVPHPEGKRFESLPRIASITVQPVNEHPLRHDAEDLRDATQELRQRLDLSEQFIQAAGLGTLRQNESDRRMASFKLQGEEGQEALAYRFYLTRSLMARIEEATAAKGSVLSQTELLTVALQDSEGAVKSDFETTAINAINASFYASEIAFSPEARPAPMYANNRAVNYALGALLANRSGVARRPLRVKELASGRDTAHWQHIAQGAVDRKAAGLHVTLTDFVTPPVDPRALSPRLDMSAEAYSLFDDMQPLPDSERYDSIITTYGLASVWHPEDMRVVWVDGQPHQEMYRIKVPDLHPRRDELLVALREGRPLENAAPYDYDCIYTERVLEPIDLSQHPYGSYVAQLEGKAGSPHFPGGLIKRVVNVFESQLTKDGVFVSADVADFGWLTARLPPWLISGAAGRYKMDNYWLAKQILEEVHGLDVELMGLTQLAGIHLPPKKAKLFSPDEYKSLYTTPDNGLLIAQRRDRAARTEAAALGMRAIRRHVSSTLF